jgi:hypothetical protein
MFEPVQNHMERSLDERKSHINLTSKCIEIGGGSYMFQAVLAHHLKTTLPGDKKVAILCHACHNGKCSNPEHLYWGTYRENYNDAVASGAEIPFREKVIRKYGEDGAKRIAQKAGRASNTKGYSFKRITQENEDRYKRAILDEPKIWGWKSRVAEKLGITPQYVGRFIRRYSLMGEH